MIKKGVGLANEGQQLRQQNLRILGFQHVNVPGAHSGEICHSHLALVCASLTEQHLPRLKHAGEGHAVSDAAPTADAQVAGFEMFQADVAFNAIGQRVFATRLGQPYHIAKLHSTPAGLHGFYFTHL